MVLTPQNRNSWSIVQAVTRHWELRALMGVVSSALLIPMRLMRPWGIFKWLTVGRNVTLRPGVYPWKRAGIQELSLHTPEMDSISVHGVGGSGKWGWSWEKLLAPGLTCPPSVSLGSGFLRWHLQNDDRKKNVSKITEKWHEGRQHFLDPLNLLTLGSMAEYPPSETLTLT